MSKLPESILVECLDALDRGEPIGAILSRYPQQAEELRPILETTVQLSVMHLQPSVAAQAKSRQNFLAQAEAMKAGNMGQRRRPFFWMLLRPLAAIALIIIIGLGFVNISATTLPGDALYGAKLFIENAQLSLSRQDSVLEERNRQNRILEIEALLAQNREANVTFHGLVDGVGDDTWRIEGLLVAIAAAEMRGEPQVGDFVEAEGLVANGRLIASAITVIKKNENPPTPEPTPVTEPSPAFTPEPTMTAVPAIPPSLSPTPTSGVTPTTTTTPAPTITSSPLPLTATPDNSPPSPTDDDHDGSDDDDDDIPVSPTDDDHDESDDDDDNSGSGSNNSGSGSNDDDDDDNSGSGSNNSGSGSDDDDNSGSGSNNSGSDSDDDDDNSGSGSSNSGSGSDDDDD